MSTSPPTSPSDPRPDAQVIPFTQVSAIALVARPDDVDHALVDMLRAHKMFEMTTRSLLGRKNSLKLLKKRRNKELGLVETRAAESLGAQVTGEDLVKFNEAARRVAEAIDAGTTPPRADVAFMISHNAEVVKRFRAQAAAEAAKKAEAKRLQDRIDELQLALEKLIERGAGKRQEPTPQQPLPGIDAVDPDPEDWMDKATKSTVITTVAYEVKKAERDVSAATAAGDAAAALAAQRRAEEHANLLRELRAAGITGEPEESQDDEDTLTLDFELADEPEADEGSDEEGEDADDAPDTTSADTHPADPEPEDPTKHPALAGAIASTKAKRAAKKADSGKPKGRGRGGKK